MGSRFTKSSPPLYSQVNEVSNDRIFETLRIIERSMIRIDFKLSDVERSLHRLCSLVISQKREVELGREWDLKKARSEVTLLKKEMACNGYIPMDIMSSTRPTEHSSLR